jgi:hypothetical protein
LCYYVYSFKNLYFLSVHPWVYCFTNPFLKIQEWFVLTIWFKNLYFLIISKYLIMVVLEKRCGYRFTSESKCKWHHVVLFCFFFFFLKKKKNKSGLVNKWLFVIDRKSREKRQMQLHFTIWIEEGSGKDCLRESGSLSISFNSASMALLLLIALSLEINVSESVILLSNLILIWQRYCYINFNSPSLSFRSK